MWHTWCGAFYMEGIVNCAYKFQANNDDFSARITAKYFIATTRLQIIRDHSKKYLMISDMLNSWQQTLGAAKLGPTWSNSFQIIWHQKFCKVIWACECHSKANLHYRSCVTIWLNTHSSNSKIRVVHKIYLSNIIHTNSLSCYRPC